MNFSGIVVTADPPHFDAVVVALEAVPGVEVHHCDRISARIIVVQEATDVNAQIEGLRRIRVLPHVFGADLPALLARPDEAEARPARMCDRRRPTVDRIGRARRLIEGTFARFPMRSDGVRTGCDKE